MRVYMCAYLVIRPSNTIFSAQHYIFFLCSFWLYHIFPHYLTNGTIFGKKKKLKTKRVF